MNNDTGIALKSRAAYAPGIILSALLMAAATPAAAQEQDSDTAATNETAATDLTEQIFRPDGAQADSPGATSEIDAAPEPEPLWSTEFASNLLKAVEAADMEGLNPIDYKPKELASAISKGVSFDLDAAANRSFTWLIEDLRDGRTPARARIQSYVTDTDAQDNPTAGLLAKAIETGDIGAIIESVAPTHGDYAKLRNALANVGPAETTKRKHIVANMDRWRWFSRDLGPDYLHTNIPEYQLRFVVNNRQISTFRTIVGTQKNQTPQMSEIMEGIVYNPTWTVPQSIVKGEGLGQRVLNNPAWAASKGYKATRGANGYVGVVQAPGPKNSLGHVKFHMPNRHAIFLHDTPSRHLFKRAGRAMSHGCIRTERIMELAMTIALVRGDIPIQRSIAVQKSLDYKLLPIKRELPVYLTYMTMATDIGGKLRSFKDIYGRDAAIHRAFAKARPATPVVAATVKKSSEEKPEA